MNWLPSIFGFMNPKGIPSPSPRLPRKLRGYLGSWSISPSQPQRGCGPGRTSQKANGHNRVAVETRVARRPRVGSHARQPWAGGHNPFGIGNLEFGFRATSCPPKPGRRRVGFRISSFGFLAQPSGQARQKRPHVARMQPPAAAFTLIEVMISSALMALILVSAYLCLGAGFSAQKLIEPRAEIIQNARVALAIMSADLRAACPLSSTDDFLGMSRTVENVEADNIDFATHNYTPRRVREGDFCQESFYLNKNPETGQFSLWRRRNPTIGLDALAGGSQEELAQAVVGLRFEYFDGLDWYDSWGNVDTKKKGQTSAREQTNLTGLPEAVRITLLMDSNPKKKKPETETSEAKPEPPFVFETVVRLNLAGVTQSNENPATSTDTSSAPNQTPGNGGNQ
jgi:prepilin-type N-terminal cleavage/methylation domain-containing protein